MASGAKLPRMDSDGVIGVNGTSNGATCCKLRFYRRTESVTAALSCVNYGSRYSQESSRAERLNVCKAVVRSRHSRQIISPLRASTCRMRSIVKGVASDTRGPELAVHIQRYEHPAPWFGCHEASRCPGHVTSTEFHLRRHERL
jgi:hypothetical protein